jgi:hypothetical protein
MGMWFLNDNDNHCVASTEMLGFVTGGAGRSIKDRCCRPGNYYLSNSSDTPFAKAALSRDPYVPGVTGKTKN